MCPRASTIVPSQKIGGEWRSLAARYVRDVEAPGSNPGSPTFTTHYPLTSLMQNAQPNDSSFSEIDSLQRAARELTVIIGENPTDADAYYQRGVVYGQLVEPLAAIRDFDQVVRLDPDNAEAYYNRGLAYVHLKEQMPAVEDFTHAIRLNPNHADALQQPGGGVLGTRATKACVGRRRKDPGTVRPISIGLRHRRPGQRLLGKRRRRRGSGPAGRRSGLRRLPPATLHAPGQKAAPLLRRLTPCILQATMGFR